MALRVVASMAAGAVLMLVAASCSSGGDSDSVNMDQVVEIFGPYRGADADRFVASLREAPGLDDVEIRYTGSRDFVIDLLDRVREDGDPPDIAMVPQPGVVQELLDDDAVVPLGEATLAALDSNYTERTRALGELDGVLAAVPYRLTVKSLVWYRPDVFAAQGWTVPRTWDELEVLVDEVDAGGMMAPWCFGIQAGTATGWAATDWVEDIVLRQAGPVVYDGWITGSTLFADPQIEAAFTTFQSLVASSGRVAGGRESILQTPVDAVAAQSLADPATCALYKQGDLALGWFPEGTVVGPTGDVDWFVLPSNEASTAPIVVGGDLAVPFDDRPAVDAVLAVLASPQGSAQWRSSGTFISPQLDTMIPGTPAERITGVVLDADVVVFDASDAMPAAVGTNAYWSAITQWIGGSLPYDRLAVDLDSRRVGAS